MARPTRLPHQPARPTWVTERLPPGRIIVVDPRVARTVFRAAVANESLRPTLAEHYKTCWSEFVDWMQPATGVIRCAQNVLAERTGLPLITVKRFHRWCRDNELLCKVVHQRFSQDGSVSGLAAGYVVLGATT